MSLLRMKRIGVAVGGGGTKVSASGIESRCQLDLTEFWKMGINRPEWEVARKDVCITALVIRGQLE